jgi:hypothetical protein
MRSLDPEFAAKMKKISADLELKLKPLEQELRELDKKKELRNLQKERESLVQKFRWQIHEKEYLEGIRSRAASSPTLNPFPT